MLKHALIIKGYLSVLCEIFSYLCIIHITMIIKLNIKTYEHYIINSIHHIKFKFPL